MNPAALKANLADMKPGTTIIVDSHDFTGRNLTKAGYAGNPLEDDSLADFALNVVDLTGMTVEAVKEFGLSRKDAARAKNMFALGLLSWMYGRPTETTIVVPGAALRQGARHPRRQRHRVQVRLELRRDHRGVRGAVRDQAGPDAGRHLPQHHRQPRAGLRPRRRRRAVRACRSSSAPTRSPRPPTSSTS